MTKNGKLIYHTDYPFCLVGADSVCLAALGPADGAGATGEIIALGIAAAVNSVVGTVVEALLLVVFTVERTIFLAG